MNTCKIPKIVLTDRNGYEFLARFDSKFSKLTNSGIVIDFDNCDMFDANLSSALGALLDRLVSRSNSVYLKLRDDHDVTKSLSRNGFLTAWSHGFTEEEKENFIIYRKFHRNNSSEFKEYVDEWLISKQKFPKHTDLAGEKILESIFEIYANAVTHGETDYVYCCGEYKPDTSSLDMTIVDCGTTIPSNVNNFLYSKGLDVLSPTDAIKWALVSGNTTKQYAGGLGLAILKDFVRMNNGCLQMVSGTAFLDFSSESMESYLLDVSFPGTIVNMKFNFNDNKNYFMESERVNLNDLL